MVFSKVVVIIIFTVLITGIACYRENNTSKVMFIIMSATTFVYSGVGIAYEQVDFSFFGNYAMFLVALLATVKLMKRKNFRVGSHILSTEIDFNCDSQFIKAMTIIFFCAISLYLFYPSFQPWKLFMPAAPSSTDIYELRANSNSYSLLKISDTIGTVALPFFFIFLKKLVDDGKKLKAVFFVILWAYISYVQYNYLSRYQLLIFLALTYSIVTFVYPEGIAFKKKYVLLLCGIIISLIPLLVAYTSIRHGISATFTGLTKAIPLLIEEECCYPQYYDVCVSLQGTGGILSFLLWLIFLPIPSFLFIFGDKPGMVVAHKFTYALTGYIYGNSKYSSSLPSVLGEGIIIWGRDFVWLHGIILGIVIGLVFNFMSKHKSLSILQMYMLLQLMVLGRGGAQSYMGTLINGTIMIIFWWFIITRCRVGRYRFTAEWKSQ